MTPEENLKGLGIELPAAPMPIGAYVPVRRSGDLVFISGMLPFKDRKLYRTGKVDAEVSLEEAEECARLAVVNALSALKAYLGELEKVRGCIKVTGYIASSPGFHAQPVVLNAASELLYEVFGEAGRHSRSAIGVPVLPLNSPVEIEFIFEVE